MEVEGVLITLALLVGFAVPVLMAVTCVVIARHLFPRGARLGPGLAGVVMAIAIPMLVILTIRNSPAMHAGLGASGPIVSIILFAASSLIAPGVLLWLRTRNGKRQ
jgi:hypothetical protein